MGNAAKFGTKAIKKLTDTDMLMMKVEIFIILSATIWLLTLAGN